MELQVVEPEKPIIKFDAEPLISFVVPAHANNLDPAILKRCLMSLDDQDYPNMEVIVVINGGKDDVLSGTARFFCEKDHHKFKLIETEQGGACNARNLGFEHSKGEIVSFFNSDYRAKPGMTRMWIEQLLNHPDCGFVYSGYEYATSPAYAYWSKPFDEYELKVANYIDCGFPLWRKYVVRWDPEVKSLQDWDFWLSVISKHKVKGHYIERDLSFIAEKPREKGLSDDSHNNWIERVKFIKTKHNIQTSDLVVTSLGAANHGREIAKMLKADWRDDTIDKPNEYKALYMIGFYMRPNDPSNDHGRILGSFPEHVKKIVHFVGADIYWLRKFPWESLKILTGVLKMGSSHILCENDQSQRELKALGIDAEIVPIPSYNDYEIKPLPKEFKVALYLTAKSDFDKYLLDHTLSIVRAMPDVQFTGYGDGATDFNSPNFKHYGVMSKERYKEYVYENSCLLRLVRHDTRPQASNDFMLAGRPVISNISGECTELISTSGTIPMDDWNAFAPGFSATRWPQTKKQIVQRIRTVKKNPYSEEFRSSIRGEILFKCNKERYAKTIYEMVGIKGE